MAKIRKLVNHSFQELINNRSFLLMFFTSWFSFLLWNKAFFQFLAEFLIILHHKNKKVLTVQTGGYKARFLRFQVLIYLIVKQMRVGILPMQCDLIEPVSKCKFKYDLGRLNS